MECCRKVLHILGQVMLEPGKYQFIGNVFLFGEKTVVKNKFTYAIANAKKFESGRVSL